MDPQTISIGVDDLDLDLFESQYTVPQGISYNSYIIADQKIAILDTVDQRKADDWRANLQAALQGRQPDYLVAHHLEPDHAALIADTLQRYPQLQLVCSAQAAKMLPNFFEDFPFANRLLVVKEGDTLSLGQHTLQFIAAPMIHWPEVIVTYDTYSHTLFSADAFGKFGALQYETTPTGDDTAAIAENWPCEARRYYFNICGKYGTQVQNLLKKIQLLDIQTVCPLHGPALSGTALQQALRLYNTWSSYQPETDGILIAHASIHGGTAQAAEHLAELLRQRGASKVVVSDLCRDDLAEVIEDAFRYPTVVLAAASYDAGVFPPMHNFLHHLQIKNYQHRRFAIIENGSWAPTAARVIKTMIEPMKDCQLIQPIVTIHSRLHKTDEPALAELADHLVEKSKI